MLRLGMLVLLTLSFSSLSVVSKSCADEVYASRTIESGTKVQLIINDTTIPATLNDSEASKALIAQLPYSVMLQRYSHGYCGVISDSLPVDSDKLHSGWLNGDIVYAKGSNELAILYQDEENSKELYDGLMTLGIINSPLEILKTQDNRITVRIELR